MESSTLLNGQNYVFRKADFTSPTLISLLHSHHATVTDPQSNISGQRTYALDVTDLHLPNIHLWTISNPAREPTCDDDLLGCGALKMLPVDNGILIGEIKTMHTISGKRGQGVGAAMLSKLIEEAKSLRIKCLYLETGRLPSFEPARRFYATNGFVECGPFADYELQENSFFMKRDICT